jgi:hypothetical protein
MTTVEDSIIEYIAMNLKHCIDVARAAFPSRRSVIIEAIVGELQEEERNIRKGTDIDLTGEREGRKGQKPPTCL